MDTKPPSVSIHLGCELDTVEELLAGGGVLETGGEAGWALGSVAADECPKEQVPICCALGEEVAPLCWDVLEVLAPSPAEEVPEPGFSDAFVGTGPGSERAGEGLLLSESSGW